MGRLDEFSSKTDSTKVSGSFWCQECGDDAGEALYSRNRKVLWWVCENGHMNTIEEFVL